MFELPVKEHVDWEDVFLIWIVVVFGHWVADKKKEREKR